MLNDTVSLLLVLYTSKELEIQESIQSCTQDTVWESDKITKQNHTQESQKTCLSETSDHKATRKIHHRMAKTKLKTKMIHKRNPTMEWLVRKLMEDKTCLIGPASALTESDVDQSLFILIHLLKADDHSTLKTRLIQNVFQVSESLMRCEKGKHVLKDL